MPGRFTLADQIYCFVNPATDCPTTPTGAPLTGGVETALKQRTKNTVAGITTAYGYDALSRLTSAAQTAGGTDSRTYGYDADGNRTSQTINGTNSTFTYNSADQAATTGYSYDADGNETATPALSALAYNPLNQTTSITKSGTTTPFSYAAGTQNLRASANSVDADLSGLGGQASTDIENSGGASGSYYFYVRDSSGNLLAIMADAASATGTFYTVLDGQGSIIALTNGSGTVKDTWTYDPYGQTLAHTGTDRNPFGYASGYTDSTTGLIHYGARYYNPSDGRFTQQDPANQGPNLYAYAGSDPINQSDPTGQGLLSDLGSAFNDVVGAVGGFAVAGICEVATAGAATPACGIVGAAAGLSITSAADSYDNEEYGTDYE